MSLKTKYKHVQFYRQESWLIPGHVWRCYDLTQRLIGIVMFDSKTTSWDLSIEDCGVVLTSVICRDIADFLDQLNKEKS